MKRINRRTMLRGTGVAIALPFLEAMSSQPLFAAESKPQPRMVAVCASLGIHAPFLFPEAVGRDYELTPYLEILKDFRNEFTLFSGLSHPDQAGADGHSSEQTWLTSARHPGLGGFRNSISLDQLAAEKIGFETRIPSLVLGTSQGSQSYTRSGVMIPAETRPSQLFARLFLDGKPEEVASQMRKLREGRSIMDVVSDQARRMEKSVGKGDQQKLDEYFQSVREMEVRLARAEDWSKQPKRKLTLRFLRISRTKGSDRTNAVADGTYSSGAADRQYSRCNRACAGAKTMCRRFRAFRSIITIFRIMGRTRTRFVNFASSKKPSFVRFRKTTRRSQAED